MHVRSFVRSFVRALAAAKAASVLALFVAILAALGRFNRRGRSQQLPLGHWFLVEDVQLHSEGALHAVQVALQLPLAREHLLQNAFAMLRRRAQDALQALGVHQLVAMGAMFGEEAWLHGDKRPVGEMG